MAARSIEYTMSAVVIGLPFENFKPSRRSNVYVRVCWSKVHEEARSPSVFVPCAEERTNEAYSADWVV
ncbi:MAG TPA: hypothetical protein VIC05_08460 [Solirubrobacteraceae bacterium]